MVTCGARLLLSRTKGWVQFTNAVEFALMFARISDGHLTNTGGVTSVRIHQEKAYYAKRNPNTTSRLHHSLRVIILHHNRYNWSQRIIFPFNCCKVICSDGARLSKISICK